MVRIPNQGTRIIDIERAHNTQLFPHPGEVLVA